MTLIIGKMHKHTDVISPDFPREIWLKPPSMLTDYEKSHNRWGETEWSLEQYSQPRSKAAKDFTFVLLEKKFNRKDYVRTIHLTHIVVELYTCKVLLSDGTLAKCDLQPGQWRVIES